MNFYESALKLEIEIPEDAKNLVPPETELCTEELIDSLEEKYGLFGEYYAVVKKALCDIQQDEAMKTWLNCAAHYYRLADHDHARDLPVPLTDGSLARDFLPLMVMLPSVDAAHEIYRKRGFSHEDASDFLGCIKLNIFIVESRILGRPAITTGYFRWLAHYMKGTIFDYGGLNFELKNSMKTGALLKHKNSGEYAVLCIRERVHRDGMPLGSAGFEDEEDSFTASFEETEDAFIGHPAKDFRISREKKHFPKSEWELVLAPEEHVINVHIPRNTDLSPESVRKAYRGAREIIAKCYPDYSPKLFNCSSWLMDPNLKELLGEQSRISQFGAPYLRYPNKSAGKEVFSFVFCPEDAKDLSALPERTTLERKLKELYVNGGFIYAYTGFLPFDQI